MLWICKVDGVRYAVGLPCCPECGSTEYAEEGSEHDPAEIAAVPEGTADEVVAWVGDNPKNAAVALAAEEASDKPRKTVVEPLSKVVERAASTEGATLVSEPGPELADLPEGSRVRVAEQSGEEPGK
jgi:hypothetical protein